jgi:hypothetical protein
VEVPLSTRIEAAHGHHLTLRASRRPENAPQIRSFSP